MTALYKYLKQIKEKELAYREGQCEDCGMVLIRDVERLLKDFAREFEAELTYRFLNKKD
jgi:hypothetical protein